MGERSKNHQVGSERLDGTGIINDFTDPATGLNCLRFYELYLAHLNPNNNRLFQKPYRAAKKFDIHDFERTFLFENQPIGQNQIIQMLATLTEILGVPRLTNHSIRTQAVQTLIKLGFPEHVILQFTGK